MTIREIALEKRQGAQGAQVGRKCPTCKFYPFFFEHQPALIAGQVYSRRGVDELGITGMCEFCWDKMEPEEDRAERTGGVVDLDVPHVPPLAGMRLQTVTNLDTYDQTHGRFDTDDVEEAQVITSLIDRPGPKVHKVVLDIDLPAQLIPSSTPGHFHLYIDTEVPHDDYMKLLETLGHAGVIEPGYLGASKDRGFTAARLPWVKKPGKAES